MDADPGTAERVRRRRRVALLLSPLAIGLLVLGVALGGSDGALGALGIVALAQGIGLAVALVWLAAGRNPLSRP